LSKLLQLRYNKKETLLRAFLKSYGTRIKFIILVPFLFINPITSNGQLSLGISSGLNYNQLQNPLNQALSEMNAKIGFIGGVKINYTFKKSISLQLNTEYCNKFYSINRTDSLRGLYTNFHNSYLQASIQFGYKYSIKRISLLVSAGVFNGIWLRKVQDATIIDIYNSTIKFIGTTPYQSFIPIHYNQTLDLNKNDNRFEFGILLSTQTIYQLKNISIGSEIKLLKSVTDQSNPDGIQFAPRRNVSIAFQLFVSISI